MIQRLLRGCGHLACTHHNEVLLVATVLTLLSFIPPYLSVSSGSGFSASISKLMPRDNTSAQVFTRALNDFGAADEVYVVFRVDHEADLPAVGRHVIGLAQRLASHPDFQDAYCQTVRPDEKDFLQEEILQRGLLYLPPAGVAEVEERLNEKALGKAVKRTASTLFAATGSEEKAHLILLKELGLDGIFRKHLPTLFRSFGSGGPAGLLSAPPDESNPSALILLAAQPNGPAQRLEYSQQIMERVRRETTACHQAMPPALRAGVRVEYAGGYQVAVRYIAQIRSSLGWTLLTSLIGVLCLFGFCYRRYGVMLYVGVPLTMAVAWTMGAGWLIFGKLNMVSCAFAAVLVGLGVDYGIHIYNRYVEERAAGGGVEESFLVSLAQTGSGVVIGMLTTSMSFFALMVTQFKGLSQFGTLAGVGLALALPAMVFVMPALVVWRSKRGGGEHARTRRSSTFGLPRLAQVVKRHPWPIAITGIAAALVCGGAVLVNPNAIRFDERLASLRPTRDPVFALGKEIARRFTRKSPARQMVLITGDTQEEALNRASRLKTGLAALKEDGLLRDYELLTQFIPSPEEQKARRAAIGRIDFETAAAVLRAQSRRRNLDPLAFEPIFSFFENHRSLARADRPVLPTDYRHTPAWRLIHRLVGRHKIRYRLDHKRRPHVHEVFARGETLVLAEIPMTRTGELLFERGYHLTPTALDLLETRGVSIVTCGTTVAGPTERRTTSEARAALERGEAVVLTEAIRTAQGASILASGTQITPDIAALLERCDVRQIAAYDKGWSVLAYIYPPLNQLEDLELKDDWVKTVRARIGEDNDQVSVTGTMIVAHDLATVVKNDFRYITLAVGLIATLVLVVCYRDLVKVFFSLLPIVLALLYLSGIMGLASFFAARVEPSSGLYDFLSGISYFNFINVLVVPIIIGLGVDNGIHLVHRFYEAGRDVVPMVADTGRAIVITNLTSMVGFGSLWVGSYKGLTSMGMLSVFGLGLSLIASVVVLPAVITIFLPPQRDSAAPEAAE